MHQVEHDWFFAELSVQQTSTVDVLVELHNTLGKTLAAAMSGTRNRHDVDRWLLGESVPQEAEAKLRFALTAWRFVSFDDGLDFARSFFIGPNRTGDSAVFVDVREGRFSDVRLRAISLAVGDFF